MVSDDGHQHGPSSAAQQEKQTQLTHLVRPVMWPYPSVNDRFDLHPQQEDYLLPVKSEKTQLEEELGTLHYC
ncbi:hypothetical protein T05_14419 [Trichinella murrelli]|uniref:Uncharacterized protein n=1 Tax=Trichinella murrelli TaxID=144512 RepID=A0A0V0TF87_9BILA|nr:hypothetical protein T05_14419 [Trichinella murrelli]